MQGWLKGVNSSSLDSLHDMGQDGLYAGANQYVARDAVGFNLNYYDTADYAPINAGVNPFPSTPTRPSAEPSRSSVVPALFAEVKGIKIYQRVEARYLNELLE